MKLYIIKQILKYKTFLGLRPYSLYRGGRTHKHVLYQSQLGWKSELIQYIKWISTAAGEMIPIGQKPIGQATPANHPLPYPTPGSNLLIPPPNPGNP